MTELTSQRIIPVQKPWFDEAEEIAAAEAIRSGWVSQGPRVAEFEETFARYVGARYAVAVSNCTTALHLALLASGVGEGDEVILPSQTFIASPNAVVYTGATPVFADIDPKTYLVDPNEIEARITPATKAIMPVHLSMPCDLAEIYDIADRYHLLVIEDAAPALGAAYKSIRVGNSIGPVCFSLHPRKIISTGEGGMITTNSRVMAEKLRQLRQHCMSVSDVARHNATDIVFEEYTDVGFNYRMTDIQAAVGIAQMQKLDIILDERRRLANRYSDALDDLGWISPPWCPPDRSHNYQSYIARVRHDAPISRDQLMSALWKLGIQTRRGIMNAHLEPAYINRMGRISLPQSEDALRETLILPLYVGMEDDEQEFVIDAIRTAPANIRR